MRSGTPSCARNCRRRATRATRLGLGLANPNPNPNPNPSPNPKPNPNPNPNPYQGGEGGEGGHAHLPQRDEQRASAFVDGLKLLKDTGSSAGPEGVLLGAPLAKLRRYSMHGELFNDLYAASSVKQVRLRRSGKFDQVYQEDAAGEGA